MKNLDIILLPGIITIALGLIVVPGRIKGIVRPGIGLIILLALIQLLKEGCYWHYLPAYALILLMILMPLLLKKTNSKLVKRLLQFTLVCMVLATIIPWTIFLPIPTLTAPSGNYKVGTRIFRWVDHDRPEHITPDPDDKRNVVVQAWYPAVEATKGTHSDYLDGLANLPDKIGVLPGRIFDHYKKVDTYGILNAPISRVQTQWPVIIFLTGNGASRAFYTSLVAGLSSYGYVVLAVDHPYEAMITQLADGKIATTIEVHSEDDTDLTRFMKGRIDTRIADIKFVMNQVENLKGSFDNFLSFLNLNRIVIAGHSLGGATAAVAMAFDSRIKAAANIDGTLYGQLPKPNDAHPFLLIESKKDGSESYLRYENGNQQFFKQFGGGYRYEILEADHYSFTDAPLLLAFPARFMASHFFEFGHIPTRTHHATVDILHAFFNGALTNNFSDLDSVTQHYQGIIRKPIN